ncbi:MAG: hypothetical protein IT376_17130 [Polyangiaceae bacterium]|nr:hypothetical protein [Polyangiaceae bacterium]
MRTAALLALGVLLVLVQGNLFRVVGPALAPFGLDAVTPSLVLPLVVYLGVHEPSAVRGAAIAFALGHGLGLFGAAPNWLFTFVTLAVWSLSRVAGVRLGAQTVLTRVSLAFIFALVESAMVLVLLAVFGTDGRRPLELARGVLPHAVATAVFAPPIFRLVQRLHQSGLAAAQLPAEAGR